MTIRKRMWTIDEKIIAKIRELKECGHDEAVRIYKMKMECAKLEVA